MKTEKRKNTMTDGELEIFLKQGKMTGLKEAIINEGIEDVEVAGIEWDHFIKPCMPKWLSEDELQVIAQEYEIQRLDGTGGLNYHYNMSVFGTVHFITRGGPRTTEILQR
jgi:hypothetical protein